MLVALDMDGVIADLITGLFQAHNSRAPAPVRFLHHDQHLHYDFTDAWGAEVAKILYEFMGEPGFFAALPIYPGAVEMVDKLLEHHHVEVCTTAPWRFHGSMKAIDAHVCADKIGWLVRNFPALCADVTLTNKKHLLRVDVLIDDSQSNVEMWADKHPDGLAVLVARPWNKVSGIKNVVRQSLEGVFGAIEQWRGERKERGG